MERNLVILILSAVWVVYEIATSLHLVLMSPKEYRSRSLWVLFMAISIAANAFGSTLFYIMPRNDSWIIAQRSTFATIIVVSFCCVGYVSKSLKNRDTVLTLLGLLNIFAALFAYMYGEGTIYRLDINHASLNTYELLDTPYCIAYLAVVAANLVLAIISLTIKVAKSEDGASRRNNSIFAILLSISVTGCLGNNVLAADTIYLAWIEPVLLGWIWFSIMIDALFHDRNQQDVLRTIGVAKTAIATNCALFVVYMCFIAEAIYKKEMNTAVLILCIAGLVVIAVITVLICSKIFGYFERNYVRNAKGENGEKYIEQQVTKAIRARKKQLTAKLFASSIGVSYVGMYIDEKIIDSTRKTISMQAISQLNEKMATKKAEVYLNAPALLCSEGIIGVVRVVDDHGDFLGYLLIGGTDNSKVGNEIQQATESIMPLISRAFKNFKEYDS